MRTGTQREVVDGRAPGISICASALLDFPFLSLYSHSSLSAEVGPLFPSPAEALSSVPPAHSSSSYLGACLESTSHSLNPSLQSRLCPAISLMSPVAVGALMDAQVSDLVPKGASA